MSTASVRLPNATSQYAGYGRVFWFAYVANALTMIAISMLVRYADFVTYLGGAEGQLGLIVGVGMIGSLLMRMAQGVGIDRYGPRQIWLWSLVFFVASLLGHLAIHTSAGWGVFGLRILMQTSLAGIFGASITYISRRVPPERMAEIIGTLGTSGFVGMLTGPQIADWICSGETVGREQLNKLFLASASLAVLALVAAWVATRGETVKAQRRQPGVLRLLKRYNPGIVMLAAVAVGAGVSLPNTFLRTYAAELNIHSIGLFFAVYAVVAFVVRMLTRGGFERYGNRPWVIAGLLLLAASMLLYLAVHKEWQFAIPGTVAGAAHALLFPAVVAAGSTRFPERYRGLGTTLMLAMFDIGNLIGAPLVGGVLAAARQMQIPAYPTMFASAAVLIASVACLYAIKTRPRPTPTQAWHVPEARSTGEIATPDVIVIPESASFAQTVTSDR